jgi:hypothetical protein
LLPVKGGRVFDVGAKPSAITSTGLDVTTTPTIPTTNSPTGTQTFSTLNTVTFTAVSGYQTWTNPYPLGASTGTGTLNGSSGTTHFIWGTTSGSYPNEVSATSNAYIRTTWPRGTTVYYKAKKINSSCSATFNGTVRANGLTTTVTFEYGTSSGVYGSSVSASTVSSISSVSATATNLSPGTYYFRIKAVNLAGTVYGSEQSVTVAATSVTASTEQSFTPPAVTTLYETLAVGGGGYGSAHNGGGGGGVAYGDVAVIGSFPSLTYMVGFANTNFNGGNAAFNSNTLAYDDSEDTVFALTTLGGGPGEDDPYGEYQFGRGGVNGPASSLVSGIVTTQNMPGYGNAIGTGGGGAGIGGAGGNGSTNAGGSGGPGLTRYGITAGSGGGGIDNYPANGTNHGFTPASSYGGGGGANGIGRNAQGGLFRFKYYGP